MVENDRIEDFRMRCKKQNIQIGNLQNTYKEQICWSNLSLALADFLNLIWGKVWIEILSTTG